MNQAVIVVRMVPPTECSPNWRGHTRGRAKRQAVAEFREQAGWATQVAVLRDPDRLTWVTSARAIVLDIEIAWAQGRRRMDDDNAVSSCKAALDGIADVLEINDRIFRMGSISQSRGEGITTFTIREAAVRREAE